MIIFNAASYLENVRYIKQLSSHITKLETKYDELCDQMAKGENAKFDAGQGPQ